jgi:hypothetical protein
MKNGTKAFVGIFMFFNNYQRKKGNQKKKWVDSMNWTFCNCFFLFGNPFKIKIKSSNL